MKDQISVSKKTVKLTSEEVRHVADLAKLKLSDEDLLKFREQLSNIIHLVNQVTEVDTKDIEPTSQVTGLENIFREDNVDTTRILSQEDVLSNSKRKRNGYFMVDAVLE